MAQATITEGLAQVDLFSGLSHRDLARIARSGREVDHKPGKEVVTQGRSGIAFHLVLGGSADLEISGQLRKRLGVGDYFGEIPSSTRNRGRQRFALEATVCGRSP